MGRSIVVIAFVCSACGGHPRGYGNLDSGADTGADTAADAAADSGSGSAVSPPRVCPLATSADPLVVATDAGLVKGVQAGTGLAFLGIPFAAPPVGSLRFMPPQQAACWSDVFDASNFGNTCAQWNPGTGGVVGSEDCLSINVWTPALPTGNPTLPVLFWIYGGGDLIGASNFQETYGQYLANSKNAVVVSFNYRMGPLGFLAHPALAAANAEHTTGNYGLLDAIAALKWVQLNIAAFGGDKNHVLLFGQSAGAINTCALVASPLAHGLFSSALMESGNCAGETLADRYPRGQQVAASVGCATASDVFGCMQNAPVDSILQSGGSTFVSSFITQVLTVGQDAEQIENLPYGPTVDGYVLSDTPEKIIQAGGHNHVPFLIGTTSFELGEMIPQSLFPQQQVVNCIEYDALAAAIFPHIGTQLVQTYPCDPSDPPSAFRQVVRVASDGLFVCPSRRAARDAAMTQSESVYRYVFTHGSAVHTAEIPYVFGDFGPLISASPGDLMLQDQIESYWVNFAATGNPNGAGLPMWATYDPSADNTLVLDTPVGNTSGFESAGCAIWDEVQ
jgi:para-nitrobenzyl esterase